MKSAKYLFLIILFSAIAGRAQDRLTVSNDDTVAIVGKNYVVTLKELRQYVGDRHYDLRFRAKSEAYRNALNDLITNRLKVFDFFDRRLDENRDLMGKIQRIVNNELMDAFLDRKFMDRYANERTAAEAYKEMDREIVCEDMTLLNPENPTKENLDSLRTIALGIEKGLSKNRDMDKLIRLYSLKKFSLNRKRKVT